MLSLEARKSSLEIELIGARREAAELVAENKELQDVQEGALDTRMAALSEEVVLLRDTNAALLQQSGEISKAFNEYAHRRRNRCSKKGTAPSPNVCNCCCCC